MATIGTPIGLLLVLTREIHTFDTTENVGVSEVLGSETIIFSPQVPQYKPRGYKQVMDNFQYGGGVRIGGY